MRSLRAQVMALVVASVLLTLTLLALFGSRAARVQFASTTERHAVVAAEPPGPRLSAAFAAGGWDAVRAHVEDSLVPGDTVSQVLFAVLDRRDSVVASGLEWLRGVRGVRQPSGMVRIERRDPGRVAVVELGGGDALVVAGGDTVGSAFALPHPSRFEPEVARQFASGVDRRLLLAVVVLLASTAIVALWLTGRLVGPLLRVRNAAQNIAAGDYGTRIGVAGVAELEPLALAFDRMAASLQRSEGLRRQMIRDVAHELRTPITNLRGQIEALQDRLRDPTPEALASLHEEAALLERLVADLDELAHADSGRLEIQRADFDLLPELQRTAEAFVNSGRVSADRLHVAAPAELRVHADRERLGQVVRNLVQNAVQHGGDGVRVAITAARGRDTAEIAVRDTGRGIAAEHLPHVFDRLYRPDPSRTRGTGGSGLGLSIVKALVEAQGGTVSIESAIGAGTTVAFTVPLAASAPGD